MDQSELEEWCAMEETVAMVANKKKTVPSWFQYHPQLLHSRTDNSASPVAIVGGMVHVAPLSLCVSFEGPHFIDKLL